MAESGPISKELMGFEWVLEPVSWQNPVQCEICCDSLCCDALKF